MNSRIVASLVAAGLLLLVSAPAFAQESHLDPTVKGTTGLFSVLLNQSTMASLLRTAVICLAPP